MEVFQYIFPLQIARCECEFGLSISRVQKILEKVILEISIFYPLDIIDDQNIGLGIFLDYFLFPFEATSWAV